MYLYPNYILHDLEFDFIISEVRKLSVTEGGREAISNLRPSAKFEEIKHQLNLVNEFLAIYQSNASFPAIGIEPLKEEWVLLKIKNTVLSAKQVVNLKRLVESFNRIHHFIFKHELLDLSESIFGELLPNKEIPEEIDRIIDRHGFVKSTASRELATIRHEIQKKKQAADRIFYRALKKYQKLNVLGEFDETVVDNKRVLAIISSFKGQVNGIIHGSSAKNSLVFIEPGECIDVNNELASLEDDERNEVRRILQNLTTFLADFRPFLQEMEQVIFDIDSVHSRALYGFRTQSTLPRLSTKAELKIIEGINPVLQHYHKTKGKKVVPLNVELNQNKRMLVISGPNAGGKSITLKTVGLFQAMIQSGLLIPAHPKSVVGLFYKLMTDIGDAQSIENELSTYSSKLEKMERFLEQADNRSLILIDEFGSGSDPELGSALAQVFLEKLDDFGAYGIITTHYNSIKALASDLPHVENASMQFNINTFLPEFVLQTGSPGSSYTFEVAEKSGIPKYLVNDARAKLSTETVKIDGLLVQVQNEKIKLNTARKKLYNQLDELKELKEKHQVKITKLEEKLSKQSALNQDMNSVLKWGKRFEGMVNHWAADSSNKNKNVLIGRFVKMMKERGGELKNEKKVELTKTNLAKQKNLTKLLAEEIAVGDTVKLLSNNKKGSVQEIRKNKYLILLGVNITTLVKRDQFVKARK